MRRSPTLLTVFTAVLVLAGRSNLVSADGINPNANITTESFTLTDPQGIPAPDPNAPGPQVIFKVVPPGAVVPPVLTNADGSVQTDKTGAPVEGSPVTILPDSHGFSTSSVVVGLDNTGQLFGIAFPPPDPNPSNLPGGLAPDGVLHFSLDVNKALTTPVDLQFQVPAAGSSLPTDVIITPDKTTTTPAAAANPVDAVNTPEPLSVLVWSVLAGAGLLRARAIRRSRPSLG